MNEINHLGLSEKRMKEARYWLQKNYRHTNHTSICRIQHLLFLLSNHLRNTFTNINGTHSTIQTLLYDLMSFFSCIDIFLETSRQRLNTEEGELRTKLDSISTKKYKGEQTLLTSEMLWYAESHSEKLQVQTGTLREMRDATWKTLEAIMQDRADTFHLQTLLTNLIDDYRCYLPHTRQCSSTHISVPQRSNRTNNANNGELSFIQFYDCLHKPLTSTHRTAEQFRIVMNNASFLAQLSVLKENTSSLVGTDLFGHILERHTTYQQSAFGSDTTNCDNNLVSHSNKSEKNLINSLIDDEKCLSDDETTAMSSTSPSMSKSKSKHKLVIILEGNIGGSISPPNHRSMTMSAPSTNAAMIGGKFDSMWQSGGVLFVNKELSAMQNTMEQCMERLTHYSDNVVQSIELIQALNTQLMKFVKWQFK